VAHTTAFSALLPCPLCHNITLQQYRLLSVTKPSGKRSSENPVKTKFGEHVFYVVG
jgi:hypothetical protein